MNNNMHNEILETLNRIEQYTLLNAKQMLTTEETALYLGISLSYLRKLMSARVVPYYKPHGKMTYFDKSELDDWMRQGKSKTLMEIEDDTLQHIAHRYKLTP